MENTSADHTDSNQQKQQLIRAILRLQDDFEALSSRTEAMTKENVYLEELIDIEQRHIERLKKSNSSSSRRPNLNPTLEETSVPVQQEKPRSPQLAQSQNGPSAKQNVEASRNPVAEVESQEVDKSKVDALQEKPEPGAI